MVRGVRQRKIIKAGSQDGTRASGETLALTADMGVGDMSQFVGAAGRSTRKEEEQPWAGRACAKVQVRWSLWPQQRGAHEGQAGRASWALERVVESHGRILAKS